VAPFSNHLDSLEEFKELSGELMWGVDKAQFYILDKDEYEIILLILLVNDP